MALTVAKPTRRAMPDPPILAFRRPPRSGNAINGLGQAEVSLARPVFHSEGRGGGRQPLEWAVLDEFFNLMAGPRPLWQMLRTLWQRRRYAGPVSYPQQDVGPPDAAAGWVKAEALRLGAGVAGVATVEADALYEGYPAPPYRFAISLGRPMDRRQMANVPDGRAAAETMRGYRLVSRIAIDLAALIRARGWPAQAYADGEDILQIPLAIRAGLGQLGKHGSLISREFGSNLRLAAVLTDLPLACDGPVDLGVDDLCLRCRRCSDDCPPEAISDRKQLVRGVEKWYVDFDRCVPYFAVTEGCGICSQVCPWSTPGRGPGLMEALLAKRGLTEASGAAPDQ